jgi:hypothetical protein
VPVHPWSQVELRRHRQAGELVGDPVTITAKMRATHTPPASRRVGGRSGDRHSKNARHAAALHSTVRPAVARRERTENRRGKYLDSRGVDRARLVQWRCRAIAPKRTWRLAGFYLAKLGRAPETAGWAVAERRRAKPRRTGTPSCFSAHRGRPK